MGFSQDQVKIVINRYSKKTDANLATLEQVNQTLNSPAFYGIPASPAWLQALNKSRPLAAQRESAPEIDRVFRSFVDKATGGKRDAVAKSA
jgi:septum formation inhibitor-activating ATPase MinD